MRLAHHPDLPLPLRVPTAAEPLRVLVSGCLAGLPCGVNGTDYGLGAVLRDLLSLDVVKAIPFCPEESGLGTPRTMPDIHGGDGFDVVDGRARVLDEHGADLTEQMLLGARNMLAHAQAHAVELAIVTDMSAACGSQVISRGCRLVEHREFVASVGVASALLLRAGIPIVSQRDHRTVGRIRSHLDPRFVPDASAIDHHETDWYRTYFGPA
ncbi:MAG: DUF523 domain-containing protein [Myxococcales bacterium]|nr:DUF523 domain-containing protein [Myxococcales bacterium]